jgi:hypothetical protein
MIDTEIQAKRLNQFSIYRNHLSERAVSQYTKDSSLHQERRIAPERDYCTKKESLYQDGIIVLTMAQCTKETSICQECFIVLTTVEYI